MIKLIGLNRLIILAVLGGLNLLCLWLYFFWLQPGTLQLTQQQQQLSSSISEQRTKIDNIKSDIVLIRESLPEYQALMDKGFGSEQDRFYLSRELDSVREAVGIRGFSFSVSDIENIPFVIADAAGKKLIRSAVTVEKISTTFDVGVFDLMRGIEQRFPPHVRIAKYEIKKTGNITPDNIDRLRRGEDTLVNSTFVFEWMTMIDPPKPDEAQVPGTPGYGGTP